jgi:hypothetical protein
MTNRKPPNPQKAPKQHGRRPSPPTPQTGKPMCRLGKAVAAVILIYVLAAFVGIVTA